MIELVRNDETAFTDQCGKDVGIGTETHGENHSSLLSNKPGDLLLDFQVEVLSSYLRTGAAGGNAIFLDRLFGSI